MIEFPCGCKFETNEKGLPIFNPNIEALTLKCSRTWDMICEGNTKGVFQLDSQLGQSKSKESRPKNIEELSDLLAIIRPGCCSQDTKILVGSYRHKDGKLRYKRKTIKELYLNPPKQIYSLDTNGISLTLNNLNKVIHTGVKECFQVEIRKYSLGMAKSQKKPKTMYNIECSIDHRFLRSDGEWVELEFLEEGDRIAVHKKRRNSNRKIKDTVANRHSTEVSDDIEWVTYTGKKSVGEKETYDIYMEDPLNNFVADDFIVHNCGDAVVKGKTLTQHYIDRKCGKDTTEYFHESLEPILKNTYGILVYQEQAMQIAQLIAGFSLQQADTLRKAIGKKLVDLMEKVKVEFLEGAAKVGKVTKNEADEIFSWIEKSQKYSFNKSHSISYAFNAYQTAYAKAHFPRAFFTAYLRHSDGKPKSFVEIYELINNARTMDIDVIPPSIVNMHPNFFLLNNSPAFGIANVKRVGMSVYKNMTKVIKEKEYDVTAMSWEEFLMRIGKFIKSDSFENMIKAGVFDTYGVARSKMLYQFGIYRELKDRDQLFLSSNTEATTLIEGMRDIIRSILLNKQTVHTARNIELINSLIISLENPPYELLDRPSWIAKQERELLGIALTCSEVDEYDLEDANCTCREYVKGFDSPSIAVAAIVDDIREWEIKKGKNKGTVMAFLKISDSTCCLDSVTIFADAWKDIKKDVTIGGVLLLRGDRDKNRGSFLVKRAQKLTQCI